MAPVSSPQPPQEWRGWIPGDPRRAGGDRRLPLPHFLRLMAGARMADRPQPPRTNDDLVAHLRQTGAIKQCAALSRIETQSTESVAKAVGFDIGWHCDSRQPTWVEGPRQQHRLTASNMLMKPYQRQRPTTT